MKKLLFNSTTALILGILLLVIGFSVNASYEDAKAGGYEVTATITRIEHRVDTGIDGAPDSDEYTLYGTYTVGDQIVTEKKLGKVYINSYSVGDTYKLVVDPENPEDTLSEGGFIIMLGLAIIVFSIIAMRKNKKQTQQESQPTQ